MKWGLVALIMISSCATIAFAQNLGFEDGMIFWDTSYTSSGQDYTSLTTDSWNSAGNHSLFFGGTNGVFLGIPQHSATINHTNITISKGDRICVDVMSDNSGTTRLISSTAGTILDGIPAGETMDACAISPNTGHLDLTIQGTLVFGCQSICLTHVYLDNIRIYSCTDGIQNPDESDVDCGGICGVCDVGRSCNAHTDCSSYYCSENSTCQPAPSLSHMFNYNFEIGTNDYWEFEYWIPGGDLSAAVNQYWKNEGNYSLALPEDTSLGTFSYIWSSFIHNETQLEAGDIVCLNVLKNNSPLAGWTVDLTGGGNFVSSFINDEYTNLCAASQINGSLGVKVQGTETFACNAGSGCFASFFFDNITINRDKCGNGVLDHFESDVDCGGFCSACTGGLNCNYNFDCEFGVCDNGVCTGDVEESLLEKYAPVLYFHPDEQFFPTSIEAMLSQSDLKRAKKLVQIPPELSDPIIDEIPVPVNSLSNADVTAKYYLDMRNASGGFVGFEVPDPNRFAEYPRTVYGREFSPDSEHIVLQYWFFYVFNHFRGAHEGDWEMIQIILNKTNQTNEQPTLATYSYHYDVRTYNWSEVNKVDETHPKVFVAQGGHASYKDSVSVWDYAQRLNEQVSSENNSIMVGYTDYSLSTINNKTNWTRYFGLWGELLSLDSIFNGPNSPANIAYGDQPNRWNNPIEFAEHGNPSHTSAITGSPVNLHAYDSQGRHTGLNSSGQIETQIPDTYLYITSNNSKELIVILTSEPITFIINATDNGAFNLSIDIFNKNTSTTTSIEYHDVQITNKTSASVRIGPANPNYIMQIDINGDGATDGTKRPDNVTIEGTPLNLHEDSDNDGVEDAYDRCPNSKPNEFVDQNGCDMFQFCNQLSCGLSCSKLDFLGDEVNKSYPNDCIVALMENEGTLFPKCVPTRLGCSLPNPNP
jgi:hypothetical protein